MERSVSRFLPIARQQKAADDQSEDAEARRRDAPHGRIELEVAALLA
jgi:hypothetical protein